MAEDEEPELRALIWATTRHLKYAQYAPTNNNRKNKPGVTMCNCLMCHLMFKAAVPEAVDERRQMGQPILK